MTNDIDYNQLGKRIKRYRQKVHPTQEQLADKIDVATSTIAHAENSTSKPSLPLLLKIANSQVLLSYTNEARRESRAFQIRTSQQNPILHRLT